MTLISLPWLAALSILSAAPSTADAWVRLQARGDVTVWKRPVPGSAIDELRAQIVVPVPLARVWEVLERADEFHEFMPHVERSQIVRRAEDGSTFEYQLIDAPIVSKRDYTVHVTTLRPAADGSWQRHWLAAANEGPPPREGVVRVTEIRGSWRLRALGPTETELTYELHTDPAGSIPSWLASKANKESIPNLLRSVRERAINPQWRR